MTERYHLVFRGECLDGHAVETVRPQLGALLKMADAQLERLFSGKPVALKRSVDKATAAKYQAVFRKAGARLRVVAAETDQPAPAARGAAADTATGAAPQAPSATDPALPQAPAPESTPEPAGAAAAGGLSLAAGGGDLLRPEERPRVTPVQVSTDHLSVAPQGSLEDVLEHPEPPPPPDTSALSLAEVGADLVEHVEQAVAAVPVPDLDLAPPGADLEELHPDVAPVQVDISGIDLAPPGADLGPGDAAPAAPAPDTSHLQVERPKASFVVPED